MSLAKHPKIEPSVVCEPCQQEIPEEQYIGHVRTQTHREHVFRPQGEGIEQIQTAFKNRVATYRISTSKHFVELDKFMTDAQNKR